MSGPARRVLQFHHVDVFSDRPMAGNGLAVITSTVSLDPTLMLGITRELRQFETIFLTDVAAAGATARIFTMEEELAFAGHPVLGAAAVLHAEQETAGEAARWALRVGSRDLSVHTRRRRGTPVIDADMNQGPATTLRTLGLDDSLAFAAALGVPGHDVRRDLPCQVVTTGLPYLLLPVTTAGLAATHVTVPDLTERLRGVGADFVYVLEPETPEGRTWDNQGDVEDVATGSAAGPAGAYLLEQGLARPDGPVVLRQGRFVGRPSAMRVRRAEDGAIWVGGPVVPFSDGALTLDGLG